MGRPQEAAAAIYFAWSGSLTSGPRRYCRIHAPGTQIQYDNTRNDANYIHSVWIDPANVFGRDLLKAHYGNAH